MRSNALAASVAPTDGLLARLRPRAADLRATASDDDHTESFPADALQILRDTSCLTAVLPIAQGGRQLGWSADSIILLLDLLRALGGAHLSLARLFEGHVNAFQLLWTFGNPVQRQVVCDYVKGGGLLGVWNAPSPKGELTIDADDGRMMLRGHKAYASGAGGIARPLVTARHETFGWVMVWPDTAYSVGPASDWSMQGMRASFTRSVEFDCPIESTQIFGHADDYHRQPHFSGGSWRFLAAQLGAGEALVELMRADLCQRGRSGDPHQRIRMTQCVLAVETALKWIRDAAQLVVSDRPVETIIQHAEAARIVVERALLDVMEMVHRSIGLYAFSRASPYERIMRDLATYLRQPAPDALLNSVAERAFDTMLPGLLGRAYDAEV